MKTGCPSHQKISAESCEVGGGRELANTSIVIIINEGGGAGGMNVEIRTFRVLAMPLARKAKWRSIQFSNLLHWLIRPGLTHYSRFQKKKKNQSYRSGCFTFRG